VRELKNLVERIVIRNRQIQTLDASTLAKEGLGEDKFSEKPDRCASTSALSLEEIERQAILSALEETGWVQSEAAKRLQISPDRMYNRIKKYGFQHPSWRIRKTE
jgi:Nif-specific regulatory protein